MITIAAPITTRTCALEQQSSRVETSAAGSCLSPLLQRVVARQIGSDTTTELIEETSFASVAE
jgi:hypothetical protein